MVSKKECLDRIVPPLIVIGYVYYVFPQKLFQCETQYIWKK